VLVQIHLAESPEAVPLGIACVASALKAAFPGPGGVEVSLVEGFAAEGVEVLAARIEAACAPQTGAASAVGFSLYNWNRALCVRAAVGLRKKHPDLFLFCGGPEVTALPDGLPLSRGGPFDAAVVGEGETGAVRLIGERFFAGSPPATGQVSPEAAPEPAGIGFPSPWLDKTLEVHGRNGVLWELARGCPYSCAYCYESRGNLPHDGRGAGNRRVRYITEERFREELRLFVRERVPYVFVLDPTFNTGNTRAVRILDLIEKETAAAGCNFSPTHWHFEVRAELITREQAKRFARIGTSLQIGLQTADPAVAALAGRDLNRGRFASRIGILNEEGVIFGLDLIYGLPTDTLAGFRRSLDFALSLYPNNLDLFRLSVLPGTPLADKAAEFGIQAEREAPYAVIATPDFPAADLGRAEQLSSWLDIFYNRGRAVAWFNQVLRPLRLKPSVFLEGFAAWAETGMTPRTAGSLFDDSLKIERAQLAYLEGQYSKAKKSRLFPAVRDLVQYHGAWGRALAEGVSTDIEFAYHPGDVLGEDALDLEAFVDSARPRAVKARVRPGKGGPELAC
jgi:hypothetical protein